MSERLARVTQALARALGSDAALRTDLRQAIAASPFPQGQLEFAALLRDPTFHLLDRMIKASDGAVQPLTVDSIVPLELYLPVPEHRSWDGGHRLLVASLLDEDLGDITAFDLSGTEIPVSVEEVPSIPTLALVPAETDFSDPMPSGSPYVTVSPSGPDCQF